MSASTFAVAFSLVAGLAGSMQVAISGALGRRIGVLEAAAFGGIVAAVILVGVAFAARNSAGIAAIREPPWLWLGGLMGAIVVTAVTFSPPRIGTFATIGLLVASQLAMGVVIDALGLFGLERIPFTWERAVGLALLAGGAVLVLKR
ncbi:MAG: DMT family transporter [Actinomycetota bacterium]|nr:DMT family transporter [Actinomycetota bacterium]